MAKLSGLLATTDPDLGALAAAARDLRSAGVSALAVEGPAALRPFLSALLAGGSTALAVTATDREAEDLGAASADLLGRDAVVVLPSWETLPHERLSPRPDTVGRRLAIFRALADPATAPRLVVAAARSLIQPIAPGLGRLDPVTLRVGDEHDFDDLLVRLVELAYTRVEMVTARGDTLEEAKELFKLPKTLEPYKDKEVLIGVGRFGPYVKHGEAFISIPRGEDPLEITDERAREIIDAKLHEDRPIATYKGQPVTKGKGRFGPFIKWEGTFVNIPKKYDPDHLTESQVFELLAAKLEKEANRYIQQWDKEKITIENGRWGPFIRKGKKAINIPKIDGERLSAEVAALLTLEEVKEIIDGGIPDSVKKKMGLS